MKTTYYVRCFATCPNTLFITSNSLFMSRIFEREYCNDDDEKSHLWLLGSYWKLIDIPITETEKDFSVMNIFRLLFEKKLNELAKQVLESKIPFHIDSFVENLSRGVIGHSDLYLTCFQSRRIEETIDGKTITRRNDNPVSKLVWCMTMKRVSKRFLLEMHKKSKRTVSGYSRVFHESLKSQANYKGKISINDQRRAYGSAERYLQGEVQKQGISFTPVALSYLSSLSSRELYGHSDAYDVFRITHQHDVWGQPSGFVAVDARKSMSLCGVNKIVNEFRKKAEKFLSDNSLVPTAHKDESL